MQDHGGGRQKAGKKTFAENGAVYEGDFHHGEPHGRGKLTCTDGDVYEGEVSNEGEGPMLHGQSLL